MIKAGDQALLEYYSDRQLHVDDGEGRALCGYVPREAIRPTYTFRSQVSPEKICRRCLNAARNKQ